MFNEIGNTILSSINDTGALSGLITAFPLKTTTLIPENLDMNLFDFYNIHK